VPDLGLEAHDGRPEGVLARDLDVDVKGAALIRRIGRPIELAAQMCEVVAGACGLDNDLGELVVLDVGDFLGDPAGAVGGSHCERGGCLWCESGRQQVLVQRKLELELELWSAWGSEAPTVAACESIGRVCWSLGGAGMGAGVHTKAGRGYRGGRGGCREVVRS
jgi:hypothetical protein